MSKKVAYINPQQCDKSPFCMAKRSCPSGAITKISGSGVLGFLGGGYEVDKSKCTGCTICLNNCPHGAINMINA